MEMEKNIQNRCRPPGAMRMSVKATNSIMLALYVRILDIFSLPKNRATDRTNNEILLKMP